MNERQADDRSLNFAGDDDGAGNPPMTYAVLRLARPSDCCEPGRAEPCQHVCRLLTSAATRPAFASTETS